MSQELGFGSVPPPPPPPYERSSHCFVRGQTDKLTSFPPPHSHSCADTPVFLAKPSVGFFTDYEIGPVYEVEILLYVAEFLSHALELGKD